MSEEYIQSVTKELRRLSNRRDKLEAEIESIDGQLTGIRKAAQMFFSHVEKPVPDELLNLGVVPPGSEGKAGSRWQSVLAILEKAYPEGKSSTEIAEQLQAMKISVNRRTVSSQLSNAKSEGKISLKDGKYYYRGSNEESSSSDKDVSIFPDSFDEEPF